MLVFIMKQIQNRMIFPVSCFVLSFSFFKLLTNTMASGNKNPIFIYNFCFQFALSCSSFVTVTDSRCGDLQCFNTEDQKALKKALKLKSFKSASRLWAENLLYVT